MPRDLASEIRRSVNVLATSYVNLYKFMVWLPALSSAGLLHHAFIYTDSTLGRIAVIVFAILNFLIYIIIIALHNRASKRLLRDMQQLRILQLITVGERELVEIYSYTSWPWKLVLGAVPRNPAGWAGFLIEHLRWYLRAPAPYFRLDWVATLLQVIVLIALFTIHSPFLNIPIISSAINFPLTTSISTTIVNLVLFYYTSQSRTNSSILREYFKAHLPDGL